MKFHDTTPSSLPANHGDALPGSGISAPAWAVSLLLHVVVLLALAVIVLEPSVSPRERLVLTQAPVEEQPLLEPVDVAIADVPADEVGAQSDQGIDMAEAVAPELSEVAVAVTQTVPQSDIEIRVDPLDAVPTALTLSKSIVVKGTVSGVGATGASGAVDRLAAEINGYLEERRETVIYWLFDQSVSLATQRKEIATRLERVFDELGISSGGAKSRRLSHIVVGYGKSVTPPAKTPTHESSEVVEAIRSIEIDDSGIEMTFTAIGKCAVDARRFRNVAPKKNVLIIVFTDEVGNDEKFADQTTKLCQTLGIPVYVVGVPAPFGQRQVRMKFVDSDPRYDSSEEWAVVEQGPETLYPEVVRIRAGRFRDDAIESGFGPFSLCKLCSGTHGLYFAVHPNRDAAGYVGNRDVAPMSSQLRRFFDPQVMRNYQPNYESAAEIDQMIRQNRAMAALVEAGKASEVSPMESPTMTFPRKDDAELVRLLGLAQRDAALLLTKVDGIHATLQKGLPDRPKIKEKRWQAGYDLALGRVLAMKVRADAYNNMLAQAKTGMKFRNPGSDTWQLVVADDLSGVDSQTQKMGKQAREYLERVVAEHPGTPWALIAADELETPLGYRWEERHTGVEKDRVGDGNSNAMPSKPRDDNKRNLAPPKPKRDLKNV